MARRGGRRARARSSGGLPAGVVVALLIAVVGVVAWFVVQSTEQTASDGLSRGDSLMASARFDEAIEAYASVPPDAPTYARAQARLAEAKQRKALGATTARKSEADNAYQFLLSLRKNWVERGPGAHLESDYAANTRYLLKRAREFTRNYPDHARVAELDDWPRYFQAVASLDKPPTRDDVAIEIKFRTAARISGTHRDYAACMRAISEFAAAHPDADADTLELRGMVQDDVDHTWSLIDRQVIQGLLSASPPNWQKAANTAKTFLDAVEAGAGLRPPHAAVDLLARAESQPDPKAGG